MAKKNGSNAESTEAVIPDANGWVTHEATKKKETTKELEPMEWVQFAEGVELEGELVRAFVQRDSFGENRARPFRVSYGVKDAQGNLWGFGEKFSFREAIRKQRLGVKVRLVVGELVQEKDPETGEETGRQAWDVLFQTGGKGKGLPVEQELKKSHRELVKRGGDLPF